jgi:uncharacterized Zn finger protein (UPF0148 family)
VRTPHARHNPVQLCKHCGAVETPTLTEGTGPHTVRASCPSCGRFIRWLSVLAPAERVARQMKHRLAAREHRPPSAAQLAYLKALGDTLSAPQTMREASERIEALKKETPRQSTGASGDVQEHIDNQQEII